MLQKPINEIKRLARVNPNRYESWTLPKNNSLTEDTFEISETADAVWDAGLQAYEKTLNDVLLKGIQEIANEAKKYILNDKRSVAPTLSGKSFLTQKQEQFIEDAIRERILYFLLDMDGSVKFIGKIGINFNWTVG